MTSKEKVLAACPDARLSFVLDGGGKYSRTRHYYRVWRPLDEGFATLAMIECYGKSEASAWKAALAYLKARGEA